MSVKKVYDNQPKEFKFSDENLKRVEEILKRYPEKNKKSAVMPLLYLSQKFSKVELDKELSNIFGFFQIRFLLSNFLKLSITAVTLSIFSGCPSPVL